MIGKSHFKAALIGAGTGVLLGIAPVGAAEIDDLKAKVEALEKQVGKIAATSVSISGYVKGDFYLDSHADIGDYFWAPSIALDDAMDANDDDGAFGAHAKQSRFRLSTSTDTSFGALKTVLEAHFYGKDMTLGLRHAHGVLGPVLAGRAWSLLVDEDTAAATVDFGGPIGVIAHRTEQIRLSLPMGGGFTGQMAVEPGFGTNDVPAFLAAGRFRAGWGAINLAGGVGRVDSGGQNVTAHGIHFGANLNVADGTQVVATFNVTRGLSDIIFSGGVGTVMDASGNLKAQETMGGMAGLSHSWSDSISTGAYFGWAENDNAGASDAAVAGTDKSLQTVHANVFWSPVPQASIGFEVMHGWREVYAKADAATKGEATRFQIGVTYSF